jgi:hypothetical protein
MTRNQLTRPKRATGAPTKFTPALATEICEAIATTPKGIDRLCELNPHWPTAKCIGEWIQQNREGFGGMYARAKERQADMLAFETVSISDDASADRKVREREDGSTYEEVDHEHIARARLRVDTRKWLAAKLAPRKYGDKVEVSGNPDEPLRHSIKVEFVRPEKKD